MNVGYDLESMYSLKGQTAIVTGGATGLGLAVTECLAAAGATVVALGRTPESLASSAIAHLGDRAVYRSYDVTDTDSARELVDSVIKELGPVTILVNNAGNHCKKPIEEMSVEEYADVLNVHLVGAFALTKAVVPHMKQQGKGSIIFQASMTSFIGQPNVTGYATAKSGCLGLVHTLAAECSACGVRVNAIAPGWIETPMFHQATDGDEPRLNKILGRIPMNHVGTPQDIGMAAAFLCSEAARYITGVCLPVDGGALIGF